MYCKLCGGDLTDLGILGAMHWHRCTGCGMDTGERLQGDGCSECGGPAVVTVLRELDRQLVDLCNDCYTEKGLNDG